MRKTILTEQQLICLLKTKNRKAFEYLYDNYAKCLYDIILRIVRSRELADDVLQDSFVKIWIHMSAYDATKGSLFTFLLNIARNTAIDRTRSLTYKNHTLTSTLDVDVADKQLSIQQKTDCIGVNGFIDLLSPAHQALVSLVYLNGYTHQEAAKALGIPLGTAKSRIKVAITQLKEQLTEI